MIDFLLIFAAVVAAELFVEWAKAKFGLFVKPAKVRKTRGPNKPKPATPATV